jgi:hypothetical protein
MIWEWNGWHWSPQPSTKPWGVHVHLPGEVWSVHPASIPEDHRHCFRVVARRARAPFVERLDGIMTWLQGVPELNDTTSAVQWLSEVWRIEEESSANVQAPAFVELELGKMLLCDDGWLDKTELAWLRSRRVPCG